MGVEEVGTIGELLAVWLSPSGLMQVDYVKPYLHSVCLPSVIGAKVGDGGWRASGPPSAESGSPPRRCFQPRLKGGAGRMNLGSAAPGNKRRFSVADFPFFVAVERCLPSSL